MSTGSRQRGSFGAGLSGAFLITSALLVASSPSVLAESRGYVISMVHTATYSNTDTCPQGGNGGPTEFRKRRLFPFGCHGERATT